jgi:hypothetical protein
MAGSPAAGEPLASEADLGCTMGLVIGAGFNLGQTGSSLCVPSKKTRCVWENYTIGPPQDSSVPKYYDQDICHDLTIAGGRPPQEGH